MWYTEQRAAPPDCECVHAVLESRDNISHILESSSQIKMQDYFPWTQEPCATLIKPPSSVSSSRLGHRLLHGSLHSSEPEIHLFHGVSIPTW